MGRSTDGTDAYSDGLPNELPEHTATLSSFSLDKYEVTVGRFRKFVSDYDNWHGTLGKPKEGDGAHPRITNTGWLQSWAALGVELPANAAALRSAITQGNIATVTYTEEPGTNESSPINWVTWFQAFAFCLWDAGRLPTEAEWEYVAAGGGGVTGNRRYPWGAAFISPDLANYYPDGTNNLPVGSKAGVGRWGHEDLAGSVWEWVFDLYGETHYGTIANPQACVDCAKTVPDDVYSTSRVFRGGGWNFYGQDYMNVAPPDETLRAAIRYRAAPTGSSSVLGFRCARD